ncbi:related to Frataxin homolog, mitochondrial [Saccharomycodes ludwigii]|uniref:ferroxidase n=2 Tax=Saccharomycodes ludwigii TaxID=36035 RepID=A0A376B6U1_9ASCO|nr:related to Frataxin homolog, mitochondrial [Saccharomycodes ludwigii]
MLGKQNFRSIVTTARSSVLINTCNKNKNSHYSTSTSIPSNAELINKSDANPSAAPCSTTGREVPQEIMELSMEAYDEKSDLFLDDILEKLEDISEKSPDLIPDVELTQGVLTLELSPLGTYVINKQPPNKQIWLSSPLSGPNRFDYYNNSWVSLRDGSLMIDTLNNELKQASNGKYKLK